MSTAPAPSDTSSAPVPPRRVTARRVGAVVLVVAGLLLVLVGIDRATRETVTSERSFDADQVGAIVVDTRAGDVSVTAAEVEEVTVVGRATTGLFSTADLDLRLDGSELLLASGCDGVWVLSCTVAFEVEVPHDLAAPVDVDTTAGRVTLRGLDDDVTVRTTAGTVRLADHRGRTARISTTVGTIEVDAALTTRSLDLHTTAGSIDVAVDDAEPLRIDTDTVVGSVSVHADQAADAGRVVVARTTAGEIAITGH